MPAPTGDPSTRRADAVKSVANKILPVATGVPNRVKVAVLAPAVVIAKAMDAMETRVNTASNTKK